MFIYRDRSTAWIMPDRLSAQGCTKDGWGESWLAGLLIGSKMVGWLDSVWTFGRLNS